MSASSDAKSVFLEVSGVHKKFCRSLRRSMLYGFLDIAGLGSGSGMSLRKHEFFAVENFTSRFDEYGVYGIAGRNGSGKTTLMRMIADIMPPDSGRITRRGRFYPILSINAGFKPQLTVRENVMILGSLMRMSQEDIRAGMEEFIDFSGLHGFEDSPVAFLSPGMMVRLGFSVVTAVKPDILLIDEVIAVGDPGFKRKCMEYIRNVSAHTIVIIVSHDTDVISRMCEHLIVMERGGIKYSGRDIDYGVELLTG